MQVEVINNIENLSNYKDDWNRVLMENHNDIPFLEMDFISKWWKYFGEGKKLFIILLKLDDIIAGFCPLMITKKTFWNEVNFIGYPQSNYMDLILLEKYREDSIKALTDYLLKFPPLSIINLHGILESSKNYSILEECFKKKNIKLFCSYAPVPYIKINDSNFNEYIKNHNKHNTKKTIKKENRLKELGELRFKLLDIENISEIFRLHSNRWKNKMDTSNFTTLKMKEFMTDLANDKEMSFKTEINVLTLNNRVLVFKYGFKCNGRYLGYISGHDNSFSIYEIGKILTMEKIKECFEDSSIESTKIYDFSIGYEEYKFLWTNTMDFACKLIFPTKNIFTYLIFILFYLKEKTTILLKRNRKIVLLKRNTLGKIKYFASRDNFQSVKKDLLYKLRQQGINNLIKATLSKLVKIFYYNVEFTVLKKDIIANKLNMENREYRIKEMSINDLEILTNAMHKKAEEIISHFYKREKCFKVYMSDRVLAYAWVDFSEIFIIDANYRKNIKNQEAFLCDLFIIENNEINSDFESVTSALSDFLLENYCNVLYFTEDKIHRITSLIKANFSPYYTINLKRILPNGNCKIIERSKITK